MANIDRLVKDQGFGKRLERIVNSYDNGYVLDNKDIEWLINQAIYLHEAMKSIAMLRKALDPIADPSRYVSTTATGVRIVTCYLTENQWDFTLETMERTKVLPYPRKDEATE